MSTPTSTDANSASPRPAPSARRVLLIVLPIAAVLLALYLFYLAGESRARSDSQSTIMGKIFASEPIDAGSMAFADADNDMVADPPTDAAKLINPDTLVFSYVASEERGQPEETWKELAAALKEKTGKEVKVAHFDTPEEQTGRAQKGRAARFGLEHRPGANAPSKKTGSCRCAQWGVTMAPLATRWSLSCRPAARSRSSRTSKGER